MTRLRRFGACLNVSVKEMNVSVKEMHQGERVGNVLQLWTLSTTIPTMSDSDTGVEVVVSKQRRNRRRVWLESWHEGCR